MVAKISQALANYFIFISQNTYSAKLFKTEDKQLQYGIP